LSYSFPLLRTRRRQEAGTSLPEINVDQGMQNDPDWSDLNPIGSKNTQLKIKIKNDFHFNIKYFINLLLSIS